MLVLLSAGAQAASAWLGPGAVTVSADGRTLYVAGARTARLVWIETAEGKVIREASLPAVATGLVLDPVGSRLIVTCSGTADALVVVDEPTGRVLEARPAGVGACAPVLAADSGRLYVGHRFEESLWSFDLNTRAQPGRVRVPREPVAAALSRDGRLLLVAHHLPDQAATARHVAISVTALAAESLQVRTNIVLPSGCVSAQGLALSPDGRTCAVTHNLARFEVRTRCSTAG